MFRSTHRVNLDPFHDMSRTIQEDCLSWSGTLPPFYTTKVPVQNLLKVSRAGCLVTVKTADQADVAFRCGRLTDAIVLEVGLNGAIRSRSDGMEE